MELATSLLRKGGVEARTVRVAANARTATEAFCRWPPMLFEAVTIPNTAPRPAGDFSAPMSSVAEGKEHEGAARG
eukprot:1194810-Prorocentrum_minimum.AAC.1